MSRVRNPVMPEAVRDKLVYVCMICGKPCEGHYGSWGDIGDPPKGTCSKSCEKVQEAKYRYPGHSYEDFINRQGENCVET